jgi:hypothetical protein
MPSGLMSFAYQVESERTTQELTLEKINIWFTNYPKFIDALFEVSYFIGNAKETESAEGHFYAFGHNILLRLPYTIRAICILIERGFYYEAMSLVRNLLESFVQLRYFHKHKDKINLHILKQRIKLKTMFEEIVPGYYNNIYGTVFSEFAHGGFASSIFRVKYESAAVGEITMGSKYNEMGCSFILNQVILILFGILNYIPIMFPQYSSLVPTETETKRIESIAWLDEQILKQRSVKQGTKEYYDLVDPLVRISAS